jgi:hypothetical protein
MAAAPSIHAHSSVAPHNTNRTYAVTRVWSRFRLPLDKLRTNGSIALPIFCLRFFRAEHGKTERQNIKNRSAEGKNSRLRQF